MTSLLFIWTLLCLGLGALSSRGDDATPTLVRHQVVIPERGPVDAYLLTIGTNRLCFVPPVGWLHSPAINDGVISMVSRDQSASIEIKLGAKPQETNATALREIWLSEIKKRQPESEPVREFECRAAGGQGLAFDVEKEQSPGKLMLFRTAFVPAAEMLFEFTLVCPQEKLEANHFAFANLLTSFNLDLPPSEPRPGQR